MPTKRGKSLCAQKSPLGGGLCAYRC